ncbi:hypothetical protein F4861DRAFT_548907 [Xylaria intraflava]|nr:hypothetical protein F4861DRAFT_548907 [Xylaria intraflava]
MSTRRLRLKYIRRNQEKLVLGLDEDLNGYPEPPPKKLAKRVDHHLPFVCISEKCHHQPPQAFEDLVTWSDHMTQSHSAKRTQLVHKHIVGHLRRLVSDSTNYLDIGTDEESSVRSMQPSRGEKRDGSNPRSLNGLKDLSHVSSSFSDTATLKLRTETTEFDIDWNTFDLALLASAPKELSPTETIDWDAVKAILKRDSFLS